jgi:hypothetical protein
MQLVHLLLKFREVGLHVTEYKDDGSSQGQRYTGHADQDRPTSAHFLERQTAAGTLVDSWKGSLL